MMVVERRRELVRQVRDDGRVLATEAARRFGVSEDSIRRDLRALAAEGLVQRVRGGALAVVPSRSFVDRASQSSPAVSPIAAAVARRIEESGGIVVLDSGSTNVRVAEALTSLDVTVVTSSPAIGAAASANGLTVIMLGGVVGADIGASVDVTAVDGLRLVRADVAVVGACAVDPDNGLSSGRAEEIAYKQAVIAASAELIVAAPAEKLGTTSSFHVADVGAITSLFTEPLADPAVLAAFRAAEVEVLNG